MGDNYYYEDGTVDLENSELRRDITKMKKMQRNNSNSMKILLSVVIVLVLIVLAVQGLLVYFTFIGTNDYQTHNYYQIDFKDYDDFKEQIDHIRQLAKNGFYAGSSFYIASDKKMNWTASQEVCY